MDKKIRNKQKIKVIIDYDGTLTQEEKQVNQLADLAFDILSTEILKVPKEIIKKDYYEIQQKILTFPHKYTWKVNGLSACYCNEGAFVLNTITIQEMLNSNKFYKNLVKNDFKELEYDPITECTNYLFHKNSALLKPIFRDGVKKTLIRMINHPQIIPIVMTNSKTDKVEKHLKTLGINRRTVNSSKLEEDLETKGITDIDDNIKNRSKFKYKEIRKKHSKSCKFDYEIDILGDTRQYHMDKNWDHYFYHPEFGKIQILPIDDKFIVDLRRPIYFKALLEQVKDGSKVIAFGDIFSLVGAVPLMMGMDFILLKAPYVPSWSEKFVRKHPNGKVIKNIPQIIEELKKILLKQ